MTKTEQNQAVAWRLKLLRQASDLPRSVDQTCRHFGLSRQTFNKRGARYSGHGEAGPSRSVQALAYGDAIAAAALLDPPVLSYESGGVERSCSGYAAEHLGADTVFLNSAQHKIVSRTGDAIGSPA